MKAFFVLGIDPDADESAIESAYRKLVVKYPPDTHPDQFKQISEAYELIKTEDSRIRYLMNIDPDSSENVAESMTEELISAIRANPLATHLGEKDFYRYLKA